MPNEVIDTKRKALKINLNGDVYGTFAEIGAGQEVSRSFFNVGAASGTVAKTISAYDMTFSDVIYGTEESGRYVSKNRLIKMLDHEYDLIINRLVGEKYKTKTFFAFANTVTTLNYTRTNDPHGWVGIRFQHYPGSPSNQIYFHVRLLDTDVQMQQRVLGMLGVNLIYAAFYYPQDPKAMIESLVDNLNVGSVEIDLISVSGPVFEGVNNILLNLYLIAKDFSTAAIFDKNAKPMQAKDLLYKKDVMIQRTKFAQKSNPHFNFLNKATEQFKLMNKSEDDKLVVMIEVLITNVLTDSNEVPDDIDLESVAKRAEEMCKTENYVIVSNFTRNNRLAKYLDKCKPRSVGMSTNMSNLKFVFNAANFGENYTGHLLNYVNDMFSKNVRLFAYPYLDKATNTVITTKNMPCSVEAKPLYDFLISNGYIIDIHGYSEKDVKIA